MREFFKTDLAGREYGNGKKMFSAGKCVACHRIEGTGGYSGPDLGSLAKRYTIKDILIAISDPSQSISEQYQASTLLLKEGGMLYGRVIYRNDKEIALAENPYDFSVPTRTAIGDVESVELSQISMMPLATTALMNKDELSDLMAYLISGGDAKHKVFQTK